MNDYQQSIDSIKDIRQMMERSSRFISLSGWSGIFAGISALTGAWFANTNIEKNGKSLLLYNYREIENGVFDVRTFINSKLFFIAAITFIAAFFFAFLFTYLRGKKTGVPIWGVASRRVVINVLGPMVAGGFFLLRMIQMGIYGLIAPGCLLFYGLALVNGSKYTLGEVRYLGYANIALGIINCWYISYGLYFWATGFGLFHIIYGICMWYKYERS